MVVGRDGKGPVSAAEGAGMIALYFGLLLAAGGDPEVFPREEAGAF